MAKRGTLDSKLETGFFYSCLILKYWFWSIRNWIIKFFGQFLLIWIRKLSLIGIQKCEKNIYLILSYDYEVTSSYETGFQYI